MASAPPTMKAALSTLIAPTMRARFDRRPGLRRREARHRQHAAGERQPREIEAGAPGNGRAEKLRQAFRFRRGRQSVHAPGEIGGEQSHHQGGDGRGKKHDPAAAQEGAERRAERHGDGESREIEADRHFLAAEQHFHQRRQQRKRDGADHPEHAHHDAGAPELFITPEIGQQFAGGTDDIGFDRQVRRGLAARRNEAARAIAGRRDDDHGEGEMRGISPLPRGEAAGQRAEQDGDEGRPFDQGVAGGQFVAAQMVGQDAVFDRAEQRRNDAEQQEGGKERRHGLQPEAGDGERSGGEFRQFQPLRDARLVKPVGQLSAEAGDEEEGQDEHAAGQRHQRLRAVSGHLVHDQKNQGVLQEIVVEGREELRPEQRRETPLGEKRKHLDLQIRARTCTACAKKEMTHWRRRWRRGFFRLLPLPSEADGLAGAPSDLDLGPSGGLFRLRRTRSRI